MKTVLIALLRRTWKPLTLITLVALSLWGYGHWRYTAGQDAANLVWSGKWSKRDAQDANAKAANEARERAEEQRRQKEADEERERASRELASVKADADAADLAASGMQKQLSALQLQLARSETGRLSAVAAASAANAETGILLAKLLGEADDLAGKFAKEADGRYVAGATCERTYDAITKVREK